MHRRKFLRTSGSCGAHVMGLALLAPLATRRVFASVDDRKIVTREKWGYLKEMHEGIWAHIATPFDSSDFTTVCNSGIIAGRDRVLVVEAFMQPAGARWMREQAEALTGKQVTDVVCTHYHADHTSGHAGFEHESRRPKLWLTQSTETAARKALGEQEGGDPDLQNVQTLGRDKPTRLDLGGRVVTIHPRAGHTASDVTIEVEEPSLVWCGDLFFNRMFPNYSDAQPEQLKLYAADLSRRTGTIFIPGHGPVADGAAVKIYRQFLDYVEDQAKIGFQAGRPETEAAAEFKLPDSLKDWVLWSPTVAERAFQAWYRLWKSPQPPHVAKRIP